ncbi:MAG: PQQ-dependent sugar dehydrogenase [Chloroflexi bacterium]|nr:PQQ-dependent sugar dehydrogenase [Chloroflexota bacterium]
MNKRIVPILFALIVVACGTPATRTAPQTSVPVTAIAATPTRAPLGSTPLPANTAPAKAAPTVTRPAANNAPVASGIQLPPGFRAYAYYEGLNRPTSLAFGSDARLYIAEQNGHVFSLGDENGLGVNPREAAQVGGSTLGIAFRPGTRDLYISTTGRVYVARGAVDGSFAEPKIVVQDIPTGRHQNDQIAFTPDGQFFFLGVGSTCDACNERDPRSASILRISADGATQEVYARGTRNPFGVAIHPQTGELFSTDNGRDSPSSGVPDELNVIVKDGDYGWPPCWGQGQGSNCQGTIFPVAEFQEHSSANGMAFYSGSNFPAEYRNNVFVALWGGNLPLPTVGKRVERVVLTQPLGQWQGRVSTFASGFEHPLAVAVGPRDGALYVADHGSGVVYRIVWEGG